MDDQAMLPASCVETCGMLAFRLRLTARLAYLPIFALLYPRMSLFLEAST